MPRVVRFGAYGAPEVLSFADVPQPSPGPGQVRIAVRAIGLNRADALMRAGRYIEQPPLPAGLGLEAAGEVDAVGANVGGFALGDAVSVIPAISMADWPTYGESIVVPAERVVRHPPALSWEQAAALWMAYLTAYGALVDIGRLGPGDPVVITAASSSVGLAAIAVANSIGAIPIAVTGSPAKRQKLLEHGAAHVVVREPGGPLQPMPHEGRIGLALDAVGGSMVAALAPAMARGGTILEYGGLSPEPLTVPFGDLLGKTLSVRGYLVHRITGDPAKLEAAKRFILDGVARGRFRPVIARSFPFVRIAEAHRFLETGAQFGKVVVSLEEDGA